MDWQAFLSAIGEVSITYVWIPLGLWTLAAIPLFLLTRRLGKAAPRIHYLSCLTLLIALPAGLIAMPWTTTWTTTMLAPVAQPVQKLVSSPSPPPLPERLSSPSGTTSDANTTTSGTEPNTVAAKPALLTQAIESYPAFIGALTLLALLASIFGLLNTGFQWLKLHPFVTRFARVAHPEAVAQIKQTAKQLRILRPIKFKIAPAHIAPFTYGFARPSVVVPANILEEKQALRTALYHELIHVKRNDYGTGLMAHFLTACFVFHPMVWLLSRHIATYRELACDKALLRQSDISPADYAKLLLRFNRHNRLRYAISMSRPSSNLKQRVQFMADYPNSPRYYERRWAKSMLLCLGILLPVVVMSCSEQPITTGLTLSHPSTGALEELGLTMQVADGWRLADTSRTTAGSSWERGYERWPENIRDVYLRQMPKPKIPEELTYGTNYYQYTDILTAEDIYDISYGRKTEFYKFELSIELRGKRNPIALELWKEGKCMYSDSPAPQVCTRTRNFNRMSEEALPFEANSGYWLESDFHYSNDNNGDPLTTPWLSYHFYVVRENRAYKIRFRAMANAPDKAHLITEKSVLRDPAIAEMLASIRFE